MCRSNQPITGGQLNLAPNFEPVRERTTGGQFPDRYDLSSSPGPSQIWAVDRKTGIRYIHYNVYCFLYNPLLDDNEHKTLIAYVKINVLQLHVSVGLLIYRIQYNIINGFLFKALFVIKL